MGDAERGAAKVAVVAEDDEDERGEDADREEDDRAGREEQGRRPAQRHGAPARDVDLRSQSATTDGSGGDDRQQRQHDARLLPDSHRHRRGRGRARIVRPPMPTRDCAEHACVRDRAAREHRDQLGQDPEHRDERGIGERLPEEPDQPRLHGLVTREEEVERARDTAARAGRVRARPRRAARARSSPTPRRRPPRRTSAGWPTSSPRPGATGSSRRGSLPMPSSEMREQQQPDQPEVDARCPPG